MAAVSSPFRPLIGIVAVVLGVAALVVIPTMLEKKEIVPWRDDLAAARVEAAQNHKPVFAYFSASWCDPCQRLKHTTWADPKVEKELQSYVPVRIDADARRDLAQQYNVNELPKFFLLDADGKPTKVNVGALNSDDFLEWLKS